MIKTTAVCYLCSESSVDRELIMDFSFIIPAYNATATIDAAVNSLLALQNGTSFSYEILIVENGSTDDTTAVIGRLAEQHPEIRLFHSEKGVSPARNLGICRAQGDWIVFIDADDCCEPGILETLPILSSYTPDLFVASYRKDNDVILHQYSEMNMPISGDSLYAAEAWLLASPTKRMPVWAKIYRTSFLKENALYFDNSLRYSEDSEFLIRVFNRCTKLIISDLVIYQYRSGTSSVMRSIVPDRIEAYLAALEKAETDVTASAPIVQDAFLDYVAAHISLVGVHDIFNCDIRNPWTQKCEQMNIFLSQPVIRNTLKNMTLRRGLRLQNLPSYCFTHHLINTGGWICYLRSLQNRRRWQRASARIENMPRE